MITGRTRLIVHLGYPTESFKAPMIYNPWFEAQGIEAVVVPGAGDCTDGEAGTGKLLGPKISLRVAGTGEIRPVDGIDEKSEFCA